MKPRFQADADLNHEIIDGLLRREPSIDFRNADEAELRGLNDIAVLRKSARDNRILVTHDRRTMPRHFGQFISKEDSSGVLIIAQSLPIKDAIEALLLVWTSSEQEEWGNRIVDLPL